MKLATPLAVLFALISTTAAADEFSDFRIPDHSAHLLSGNLSGSMSRQESDRASESSLNEQYFGRVGAQWRSLRETDPTSLSWGFSFDVDGRRNAGHVHEPRLFGGPGFDDRSGATELFQNDLALDITWRTYPWPFPVGFQLNTLGDVGVSHEWQREQMSSTVLDTVTSNTLAADSRHDRRASAFAAASVMVGVGRVRDVSGIYRARLLARRLESSRLLARSPSTETIQKLAALFYAQSDFFLVHDRPDKFFWTEVEKLLREDGALAGSMDAYGVFRALESPSPLGAFFRSSGFFVGAASSALHSHTFAHSSFAHHSSTSTGGGPYSTTDDQGSFGASYETNHVLVGPAAEFHRPVGLRWQFDARTQVLFDVPNDPIRNGMAAQSTISGTWILADRWYAASTFSHERFTLTTSTGSQSSWTAYLDATLGYQVEDRLRLELSGIEGQSNSGGFYPGFDRSAQLRVGLKYDVSGSMFAPGLIARQGLTPGSIGP